MKTVGQTINEMPLGKFVTLQKIKPMGALQARKQASGAVAFFWRYSIGQTSERVLIGLYDSSAPPKSLTPTKAGHSVACAVRAAEALAVEHHKHREQGGRPAIIQKRREAVRSATEAERRAAENTLTNLLADYCDHLQELGRRSHSDARSIFKLHIVDAWPKVGAMPAKEVTDEQFADMMRRLIDAGKGRTANKLRSYARAAYQMAKASRSKASIPVAFKSYEIRTNPVADTVPDEAQNKPDKNPLSTEQMRTYWRAIKHLPSFKGALLRVHVLTGGQRIEQLVNLKTTAISDDAIVIHDGKGRPGQPARPHRVPLIAMAVEALRACAPVGEFALSTDGGNTHVSAATLSEWAADVARDLIADFQTKRIRSGVETLLGGAGVSLETRGRLQSHGVSGVQRRHYDGNEYVAEKLGALQTLYKLLEQRTADSVHPIKKRRAVGAPQTAA